jgi:hypothetical protein
MSYKIKSFILLTSALSFFALCNSCFLGSSKNCTKLVVDEREVYVYFTAEEKRSEPVISDAQVLKHPGKVYVMDDFIFLTEDQVGFHIIDNRNPESPKAIKFIKINGNWDLTLKGNTLYADSYADLLVFDVSKPSNPKLIRRLNDVFDMDHIITRFKGIGLEKEMVKEVKTIRQEYLVACSENVDISSNKSNSTTNFQAGSMTRFCTYGSFLYAVDEMDLNIFNIQVATNPVFIDKIRVDDKIETIFRYDKRLFIGGLQGVYMYDVSKPVQPVKLNFFKHVESCDPVVVDRDFAYFTTRKEATCKRGQNMLTVLDVKDFNDVKLISEFPMQHPHGLGVKEDKLYIADGEFGLKVFDITKKDSISDKLVYKDTMYHSFDVIPHFYKPYLISVGKNGLLQYDISDIKKIKKIGSIMVYEN